MNFYNLKIFRWNVVKNKPYIQEYKIKKKKKNTLVFILDLLYEIKINLDSTLTFKKSCREGICGSCAMNINGKNTLACLQKVFYNNNNIEIYPLPHIFIFKDLISNLKHFFFQYKTIKPWKIASYIKIKKNINLYKQFLNLKKNLKNIYECILCACCSTSCPSYWWNNEKYLGPATLLQTLRWILDNRDKFTLYRLKQLEDPFKLYRCHYILNCSNSCPKNLDPASSIFFLKNFLNLIYINSIFFFFIQFNKHFFKYLFNYFF